jgi:preprotein translocase SecE subunit
MASNSKKVATTAMTGKQPSNNPTRQFLEETWLELRYKVTWPNRPQLIKATTVVLVVVILVALYVYLADIVFGYILKPLMGSH